MNEKKRIQNVTTKSIKALTKIIVFNMIIIFIFQLFLLEFFYNLFIIKSKSIYETKRYK